MKESFLSRLSHIPVVSSTVDCVGYIYSRSKDQNPVIRLACNAAEFSLKVAVVSAQPLLYHLEQPIDKFNQIACSQLDKLQTSYPVISSPPELLFSRIKQSVTYIFSPFTDGTFYPDSELVNNVELSMQKPDSADSLRSVILTWRLSQSSLTMWFLPNPIVLFSFADKMAFAIEHSLAHLLDNNGGKKEKNLQVILDVACTFYSDTLKRLGSHVGVADDFLRTHDVVQVIGSAISYQCIQGMFLVLFDWCVSHSPLVFLMPDFTESDSQVNSVYELDDAAFDGVIGFVPLNPADLAALPTIRPMRVYWKRRH